MSSVSSQLRNRLADTGSLLPALDAVTNWRAFATLAGTFVLFAITAAVLGGISAYLASKSGAIGSLMGFVSLLVGIGVLLVGLTAAGIHVSDDVWERDRRDVVATLLTAAFTAHRIVIIGLLAGLLLLAFLIVLGALLFICKIPGLGPLLYAIALPIGSVAAGVLVCGLFYVMLPLAAPAVWNGSGVMEAMAMLKEVAKAKLLYVILMNILLGILVFVAGSVVGLILFSGSSLVLSLSAVVVGATGGMDLTGLMMGIMMGHDGSGGYGSDGGGSGYGVALAFGLGVLFLLGSIPAVLIFLKGLAIIYRGAIADLDFSAAETALRQGMRDLGDRMEDVKKRALTSAQSPATAPAPAATAAGTCPACHCAVGAGDLFCGECGHRLR